MDQLTKKIIVGVFELSLVYQIERIDKRPIGSYPTPRQVGVMAGGAIVLAYVVAFVERQLKMTPKT